MAIAFVVVAAAAACGDDDDDAATRYEPSIDPARFTAEVDNPYFPLRPGTRWVYESETDEGMERNVVEVTDDRREVMGVETVVVHDVVMLDGVVIEDTFDWYAQDDEGTVWYFGEDTTAYDDGEASKEGSWEAGVDGAQPGIVMEADPAEGDRYRQEYLAGEAEDMGEVRRLGGHISVPAGDYDDVLVTRDWTPLEPDVVEEKYYAPGVGLVFEAMVEGGDEQVALVELTGP
jgi:hypothetical protein